MKNLNPDATILIKLNSIQLKNKTQVVLSFVI